MECSVSSCDLAKEISIAEDILLEQNMLKQLKRKHERLHHHGLMKSELVTDEERDHTIDQSALDLLFDHLAL